MRTTAPYGLGGQGRCSHIHNSERFGSMPRVANIPRYALHVHNASRRIEGRSHPRLCTKPHFSLLFQGVLMLGWIMFSVPAVFWGGILPFATVRYRYMKDQMTVGNVNMGHGSTHALPIANGALTLSGKAAVVGLSPRTSVKAGDSICVYVREDYSHVKTSDITWIMGRSLWCLTEVDMNNRWKYAVYAWVLYWPSLLYFMWLGFFRKKGIFSKFLE